MGLFGDNRFVDLGLSVKWAKCNIGATAPYELGGLYSWGETQTKSAYREDTYKFYQRINWEKGNYLKYRIFDSLELEDDVAYQQMGRKVRIPTANEWMELFDWNRISSKKTCIKGRWGLLFTSQVKGYKDNSLFIPFAGCVGGIIHTNCSIERQGQDNYGYYWTRNPSDDYICDAKYAYLPGSHSGWVASNSRWRGYSVRAIKEK